MKKNQLYWMLQFGGWGGLMVTNFLASAMLFPIVPLTLINLFTLCLAVFSSHLYRLYVKKRKWLDFKIVKLIPRVFLASLMQGTITALLSLFALAFAIVVHIQSDPEALLQMMGLPVESIINLEKLTAIEPQVLLDLMGLSNGSVVDIDSLKAIEPDRLLELMNLPSEMTLDRSALVPIEPIRLTEMMGLTNGGVVDIESIRAVDNKTMLLRMGVSSGMLVDADTLKAIEEASMAQFSPGLIFGIAASFVSQYSIFYISWSALYFAYQFLQKNRQVEIEKWKLQASFKDAELSALKSQINPHFIFNSLNNIRSLVAEDGEKARDSITHLSDLLRFSIQFDQYEKVSLEKEMEVVKDYLELESIQLEERLDYSFDIAKDSWDLNLPPMIIQTLVENAIKHSINELPNGGKVIVESELSDDYLKIFVKNSGQLKNSQPGKRKGIGIKNSRERLRLLYGEKASLSVENMNEEMVCATIRIPLN